MVSFKHVYAFSINTSAIDYHLCQNNYFTVSFVFQASRDVVRCYSTSLSRLHQLCFTMCSGLSDSEHEDREGWKLLKGVVPHLLVGVAAHTGQHYWTSADTRSTANGVLCFISLYCVLS